MDSRNFCLNTSVAISQFSHVRIWWYIAHFDPFNVLIHLHLISWMGTVMHLRANCVYQDRLWVQTEYKWLRHHHRHPGRCKPNSRWNRQQQRVHVHQEGDLIFPTSYKLNCLKFYRNALDLRDHGWNKRLYYSHQSIKLAPYFLSPATTGHELQKWLQTESSEDRFCLP